MSNLITRSITGVIFVVVLVGSILWSPYSFIGVFALLTGFLLTEFYQLMNRHQGVKINILINTAGGTGLFLMTALYNLGIADQRIFLAYLAYLLYMFISELYRKKPDPIKGWAYSVLGQAYIALPFSLLPLIGFSDFDGIPVYTPIPLLALFVFIWMNDTGAYLVGSRIGKRRLFERISPKKSWEGFYGGIAFSLIAGFLFSLFSHEMNAIQWMAMALIVSVFSTWGDLSESLMKRTIGVKDSGNMLPGHGGFLDRFDSVLLACPAVVIYLELLNW